ncbi:NACHT domain-containing protein [Nocardia terrae]|uniref:NACHT domain-containing protein n=1 Tax=Nocardia terrae TaxID=2675851 RepID=UPI0012F77630|nr:NACHT domain-containing protein [Nocardia terrae]
MTGLELLFGRVVASSAGRAAGLVYSPIRKRISDRKAAKQLIGHDGAKCVGALTGIIKGLEPSVARKVENFLKSPEFEKISFEIATKQILRTHGDSINELEHRIKEELNEVLTISIGRSEHIEGLGDRIYDTLVASVQSCLKQISPPDNLAVSSAERAALVRNAGVIAAASARNTALLKNFSDLAEIDKFENEYRHSVRTLHSMMKLPHAGTSRQVPFKELFVEPLIEASADEGSPSRGLGFEEDDRKREASLADLIEQNSRLVLLGNPGGGKSTCTLKQIFDIASNNSSELMSRIPFLVVLRDYAPHFAAGVSIKDYIEMQCAAIYSIDVPDNAIEYILLNGRSIVFFDGLDELLDTSDRRKIVTAVEGFAVRYPTVRMVVTSRNVGYDEAALNSEMFSVSKLGSFNLERTRQYVEKWFALDESIEPARIDSISNAFLVDSSFVSDLTSNPLMLSLMCGIYAFEGYIPRNRPDVYEKCALLLFERWDKQRGIAAAIPFDAHVQSAIRSIAFEIFTQSESSAVIRRDRLITYVKAYLLQKRFEDELEAEQAAIDFIDFCKGRAWVLTDLGSEVYGFTHRTFLEYFSASHFVRTNAAPERLLDRLWDRICRAEWDVVCQLSLQILGKTVDDGADDFLEQLISSRYPTLSDFDERRNALSFCLRALSFIVPRPQIVREIVHAVIAYHYLCIELAEKDSKIGYLNVSETTPVVLIPSVAAENRTLVSRCIFERLMVLLQENPDDQVALSLGLYLPEFESFTSEVIDPSADQAWRSLCLSFTSAAQEFLERQALTHSWAAQRLYLLGRISMEELLTRFGLTALFDGTAANVPVIAPIAFWALKWDRIAVNYPSYYPNSEISKSDLEIIGTHLMSLRPPWIYLDDLPKGLRYVYTSVISSSKDWSPEQWLLYLAIIDYETKFDYRRSNHKRKGTAAEYRRDWIAHYREQLEIFKGTRYEQLVTEWTDFRVDFMS